MKKKEKSFYKGRRCAFEVMGYDGKRSASNAANSSSQERSFLVLVRLGEKTRSIYFWTSYSAEVRLRSHEERLRIRQEKMSTTKDVGLIVEFFFRGKAVRSPKVNSDRSWYGHGGRSGIRDQVEVEGAERTYYLWGSPIAKLNGNILTLDNCGYSTKLTAERLRRILRFSLREHLANGCRIWGSVDSWNFGCYMKTEEYPLVIDIRARRVLNKINSDKYWESLCRTRSPYWLPYRYAVCQKLGEIPENLKDKVSMKLVAHALTGGESA